MRPCYIKRPQPRQPPPTSRTVSTRIRAPTSPRFRGPDARARRHTRGSDEDGLQRGAPGSPGKPPRTCAGTTGCRGRSRGSAVILERRPSRQLIVPHFVGASWSRACLLLPCFRACAWSAPPRRPPPMGCCASAGQHGCGEEGAPPHLPPPVPPLSASTRYARSTSSRAPPFPRSPKQTSNLFSPPSPTPLLPDGRCPRQARQGRPCTRPHR